MTQYHRILYFYHRVTVSKWGAIVAWVATIAITVLWFYSSFRYSVNILFSDAWDFHRYFMNGSTLVEQFNAQAGPHRMGIGLILTGWLNTLSGWDARWISITIAAMIFASALVYLRLKAIVFGKINLFDLSIAILVLSLVQFEVLVVTPFMSYSAVPALLVSMYCLVLLIKKVALRNALLLMINFNLVYSGFGFFMGVVTLLLFSVELCKYLRTKMCIQTIIASASLMLAIGTLVLFFYGYTTDYTKDHVQLAWDQPWKYLYFIFLSYAGLVGLKGIGYIQLVTGFLFFSTVCFIMLRSLRGIFQSSEHLTRPMVLQKLLFVMTAYPLLFVVSLACGRMEFGLEFASSSRYTIYLLPSVLAIYFFLNSLNINIKAWSVPLFFVLMLMIQWASAKSSDDMQAWQEMKSSWKEHYLKNEDADLTDSLTGFRVHPDNKSIQDVLKYLKNNDLNLYSGNNNQ